MPTKTRSGFVEFMSIFGNALAASAAVNTGRQPKARDLRGLGIDPEQFRQIKY